MKLVINDMPSPMTLSVGGVTTKNALTYLEAGASHVIVTSYVFHDGSIAIDRLQGKFKFPGFDFIRTSKSPV